MSSANILQKRVRAKKESSDDEDILSVSDPQSGVSDSETPFSEDESSTDASHPTQAAPKHVTAKSFDNSSSSNSVLESGSDNNEPSTLSFGALARAQESLGKRKRPSTKTDPPPNKRLRDSESTKTSKPSRPSKHAPQALSAKHAVSRHRSVISAPTTIQARDPRFDPLTGPLDPNRVKQTYSFLKSYNQSEIAQLKSALRAPKLAPEEKEKLQKALRRMESRKQADERKEAQQKVVREHRKEEKEKVKEGKRPFFLKKGELRKRVLEEKFEGMGEKKRERAMEKRTKRKAQKEKRHMPERRGRAEG